MSATCMHCTHDDTPTRMALRNTDLEELKALEFTLECCRNIVKLLIGDTDSLTGLRSCAHAPNTKQPHINKHNTHLGDLARSLGQLVTLASVCGEWVGCPRTKQ